MSSRQLIFLSAVGVLTFVVAIVTGPMVLEMLLGETAPGEQAPSADQSADPSADREGPHPEAAP
jgi:hypothetical protein